MTVPPGENGWLMRLEELLFQRQSSVAGLLRGAGGDRMNAVGDDFDLPRDKERAIRKATPIV